ncbi:hypothetical protein [uncultured Cohaesibacter sp.]|uniref:hypothetical protein n=1 Tax=uncultured Cohaesibacter sp. TaxID=1002546 RepID=UPI0029C762A3|nr:hypothetical protein [uncultured Cohaesibacter sp.]
MTVPSNVKTSKPKNSWGIRLSGEQCVQDMLKDELRKPNDPYVEEVISDQGTYLVLRAKAFNDIDNAKDVYTAAEKMLKSLNGIAKLMWHSSPINFDTVVALSDLDQPKRHVFIKIDAIKTVSRGNPVRISEIDREGKCCRATPFSIKTATLVGSSTN